MTAEMAIRVGTLTGNQLQWDLWRAIQASRLSVHPLTPE